MSQSNYIFAETVATTPKTLFFTFHGTGGTEAQFHDLASELVLDAHVVSPRGDVFEGGAARFFRRTGEGVYDMDDLASRTRQMGNFIAEQRDRVGATHVVALGYSNGANMLASVLLARPELVDETILLHPLIPWDPSDQPALKGRRILITAGKHDPICPPDATLNLQSYLERQEADARVEWHEGGHEIKRDELIAAALFLNTP